MGKFITDAYGDTIPVGIYSLTFFGVTLDDWLKLLMIVYIVAGIVLRVIKIFKKED